MKIAFENQTSPLVVNDHGVVMMRGTRVPLDSVIGEHLDGASPEQIVANFTTLRLADVYYAIGYYLLHRAEVDAYLGKREEESRRMREEITSQPEYRQMVDRMKARAKERGMK